MTRQQLVMAQINPLVGDVPGNARMILEQAHRAQRDYQADVVIFPELCLLGYPPEDLLLRSGVMAAVERQLARVVEHAPPRLSLVLGYPRVSAGQLSNMAGLIGNGRLLSEYAKQQLPNYLVFDEQRWFRPGSAACLVDLGGIPCALSVCEDIWEETAMQQAKDAGAACMININASPFSMGRQQEREKMLARRARQGGMPVVYVNQVGGQDELVFDGGSTAVDPSGRVRARAPLMEPALVPLTLEYDGAQARLQSAAPAPLPGELEVVYQALLLGLRDYVEKNHFPGVVLGLSGGIDSALVLALAVDALGRERVQAVMMPSRYTSAMSLEDAAAMARTLGVRYLSLPIEGIFAAAQAALREEFAGLPADVTEENLQARCRGLLLMALSNKHRLLVLATGNKSEMAVGYATLYGDMAGGFALLRDVPKTLVYRLAEYRNSLGAVIPRRVIERPPTAELAADQKDEDQLPPYDVLDPILELYVEQDRSVAEIAAQGFPAATVQRIAQLVVRNEYKRRQAPPGVRITERAFGRDRRYPITSGWHEQEST